MIYYYHGDINNFNLSVFEGTSYDVEITAGEVLIGGGIISVAPNERYPGEYLIGIGDMAGAGVGSPVSGNATWQQTKLW